MLAKDPNHADSWHMKGYALYQIGQFHEALQNLDRALSINPHLFEALTYKGLIYSGFGKHPDALELYDRALSLNPSSSNTWYVKGLTLALQEKFEDAISAYERVLALDPKNTDALAGINSAMKKRGKEKRTSALPLEPSLQQPVPVLASPPLRKVPSPNESMPVTTVALKFVSPPRIPADTKKSATLATSPYVPEPKPAMMQPDFRSSPPVLRKPASPIQVTTAPQPSPDPEPRKHDPPGPKTSYEEMIQALVKSLSQNPHDSPSWIALGDLHMHIGKYQLATEAYEQALKDDQENAKAWGSLGDSRKKLGVYDEALFAYEQSLEREPGNAAVWISHAKTLTMLGSYDKVIESLDRAISLEEKNIDALLYKGFVLKKVKRRDDALNAYERVLTIHPGDDQATRQKKSLIEGH
jgi:tetratricopeptide (TPR) repeat protein